MHFTLLQKSKPPKDPPPSKVPPPSRARMTRKRRRAAATARRAEAEAACLMATFSHAADRSSRRNSERGKERERDSGTAQYRLTDGRRVRASAAERDCSRAPRWRRRPIQQLRHNRAAHTLPVGILSDANRRAACPPKRVAHENVRKSQPSCRVLSEQTSPGASRRAGCESGRRAGLRERSVRAEWEWTAAAASLGRIRFISSPILPVFSIQRIMSARTCRESRIRTRAKASARAEAASR